MARSEAFRLASPGFRSLRQPYPVSLQMLRLVGVAGFRFLWWRLRMRRFPVWLVDLARARWWSCCAMFPCLSGTSLLRRDVRPFSFVWASVDGGPTRLNEGVNVVSFEGCSRAPGGIDVR